MSKLLTSEEEIVLKLFYSFNRCLAEIAQFLKRPMSGIEAIRQSATKKMMIALEFLDEETITGDHDES